MVETVRTLAKPAISVRMDRLRPPAPEPLETAPGPLKWMRAMRNSPIEAFTHEHFEKPMVMTRTTLGPVAVVSAAPGLRRVLVENTENYRRAKPQRDIITTVLGNGVLAAEGEQWRLQRRISASHFTPRRVAGQANLMAAAANRLVGRLGRLPDASQIDISSELQLATLHVLERTVFTEGIGVNHHRIIQSLTHYQQQVGRLHFLNALHAPRWLPRITRLRTLRSVAQLHKVADCVLCPRQQHLSEKTASEQDDLLTLLLLARDPKTGRGLNLQEIKDNILTFILTGFENTANVLTWTLCMLALDEQWRDLVEAEADRELPDWRYGTSALDRLVATRAVIEETMRLYPPVPISTRQAIGTDTIFGQEIAPGTIVVFSPWVIHRHRLLWRDPDLFNPSRFLPGAREAINRFSYLPFGAGPRTCIGASFAIQEMTILLATIVRKFRLDVAPGHRVWPIHRVTLRPQNGMPMIVHHRRLSN